MNKFNLNLLILSLALLISSYRVKCNHTSDDVLPINKNVNAKKDDLSMMHVPSPILETEEQNKSNVGASHIKPRKEAIYKVDNNQTAIKDDKIKAENITTTVLQKVSETGITVSAPVPAVSVANVTNHNQTVHVGREGIIENKNDTTKKGSITISGATKLSNVTTVEGNITKTHQIEAKNSTNPVDTKDSGISSNVNATTVTTTTTTTTTTTSTTTTPKPKKPKITYSVEDMPSIANIIPEKPSSKFPMDKLNVDEPEQPIAQPSQEFEGSSMYHSRTDYIIPIVGLMFTVPIIMGAVIIAYRRIRDYWSTRHYRRMDFLVDGMYND